MTPRSLRALAPHEFALLDYLIAINEPLYGEWVARWRAQIRTCQVFEISSPYYIAVKHEDAIEESGCGAITLGRDLHALDEGVPVLIFAVLMETPTDYLIDIFEVDRADGQPLTTYPVPGDSLMILEAGKWVGGADYRHVSRESDSSPPRRLRPPPKSQ